jgi:hypothetical protein
MLAGVMNPEEKSYCLRAGTLRNDVKRARGNKIQLDTQEQDEGGVQGMAAFSS